MSMPIISVDVEHMEDGTYDVYISHEGSSGLHYQHVTAKEIGVLVEEEIETLNEMGY